MRIRRVWEKEGQAWRRRYWKEAKYRKKAEAMGFLGDADSKESACVQQTQVQSLGQENLLEKGKTTHSNILAWRILWTEAPGSLQSMGLQSWTRLSD